MATYLFGAEVNRIQETVFRGNMQRQVVGGSRLLAAFGDVALALARQNGLLANGDLVYRGGRFRLLFDDREKAVEFGQILTQLYIQLLDGDISVAEPIQFDDQSYSEASVALKIALDDAKSNRASARAIAHAPTTAMGASSGNELARHHKKFIPAPDVTPNYLGEITAKMAEVGYAAKGGKDDFLGQLNEHLSGQFHDAEWLKTPEKIATETGEHNSNVAYLVADGNNMGLLFDKCESPDELRTLSQELDEAIIKALATATERLLTRNELVQDDLYGEEQIPVMPLIMAGDDIFVMLPARYALAFARSFCLEFEGEMGSAETASKLSERAGLPPTMSAAVIFCKQTYPYHLAHQRGEEILKATKRIVKLVKVTERHSAVGLSFIIGNELVRNQTEASWNYLGRHISYWAADDIPNTCRRHAPSLKALFDAFERLDDTLPNKRLNELRQLYSPRNLKLPSADWNARLLELLERIQSSSSDEHVKLVQETLSELGDNGEFDEASPGYWLKRPDNKHVTGVLDLYEAWQYLNIL